MLDTTPGLEVDGRFAASDRCALERTYIDMAGSILVLKVQTELPVHGLARSNDLLDEIKVIAGTRLHIVGEAKPASIVRREALS